MDTESLRYFLELLECGSLNKTAEKLFVSQSALRANITDLENEIGAPLVTRTKKGCTATDIGLLVASEAPVVLDYLAKWQKYSALNLGEGTEQINLFSTRLFCDIVGTSAAALFFDTHQRVRVSVSAGTAEHALTQLKNEGCNIAVIHAYSDDIGSLKASLPSKSFVMSKLIDCSFDVVLNKRHPMAVRGRVEEADLREMAFVTSATWEMFNMDKHNYIRNGFNSEVIPLKVDNQKNLFRIIQSNPDYYGIVTDFMRPSDIYRLYDQVCHLPLGDLAPECSFYLIHKKESLLSPVEQEFIRVLCEYSERYEEE